MDHTVIEYNRKVSPKWSTLDYLDKNTGLCDAVDLSEGWHTRRLMVPEDSPLVGQWFYHMSVMYNQDPSTVPDSRYVTFYVRNIRIRNVNNEIKYTFFDGTESTNEILGTTFPPEDPSNPTANDWLANADASVRIVDDPLLYTQFVRPERDSEDEYVSVKVKGSSVSNSLDSKFFDIDYTVASGDVFSYSVATDYIGAGVGSLDIVFTDGTRMTDVADLKDCYGVSAGLGVDLQGRANFSKYTDAFINRRIDLSGFVGKTVDTVNLIMSVDNSDDFEVGFDDVAIINSESKKVDIYSESVGTENISYEYLSGDMIASVSLEPLLYPAVQPTEYSTFEYKIDSGDLDVNRHYNVSLFGYASNPVKMNVGDMILYDVKVDKVLPGTSYWVDYQVEGGNWGTMASYPDVLDQRGKHNTDTSFVTEADKWYTRRIIISKEELALYTAHITLNVRVNGIQTEAKGREFGSKD